MKECPQCKTNHQKEGIFCSKKCANSRPRTEEYKAKMSMRMKELYREGKVKAPRRSRESYLKQRKQTAEQNAQQLMIVDFDVLSWDRMRLRVCREQNGYCNKCNNNLWLGEPLVLEVDHKDGNRHNNSRDNLEALCPNCHSMTKTWRGRNKDARVKQQRITDEQMKDALIASPNIRQALLSLNIAAKGANYSRALRILQTI